MHANRSKSWSGKGFFSCVPEAHFRTRFGNNKNFISDGNLKSGKYDNNYRGACNPRCIPSNQLNTSQNS